MKKVLKRVTAAACCAFLMFSFAACSDGTNNGGGADKETESASTEGNTEDSSNTDDGETKKIGVAMPTKDLQRWVQDGDNMKKELEAAGYEVDLQYANNDIATQVSQIENMVSGDCDLLVIAAIDGSSLGTALQGAKDKGITVIAYDRLIMQTDAVSYYATFDNYLVGKLQGEYIEEQLGLQDTDESFHIELFTGSSDDNNVNFFFNGAMEVLNPYIDDGTLVVKSGSTTLAECATPNWSTEEAQKRMENIITAYYSDGTKLDAVLSSNDSVANGITNAIDSSYNGDFPVLTGQDCDITSVKNILNDKQSMSIFKDTRTLAAKVVEMITAHMNDEEVPVNDTETYDNGTKVVPSFLCEPVFADKDNYKELLIDSGYYTEEQLQ